MISHRPSVAPGTAGPRDSNSAAATTSLAGACKLRATHPPLAPARWMANSNRHRGGIPGTSRARPSSPGGQRRVKHAPMMSQRAATSSKSPSLAMARVAPGKSRSHRTAGAEPEMSRASRRLQRTRPDCLMRGVAHARGWRAVTLSKLLDPSNLDAEEIPACLTAPPACGSLADWWQTSARTATPSPGPTASWRVTACSRSSTGKARLWRGASPTHRASSQPGRSSRRLAAHPAGRGRPIRMTYAARAEPRPAESGRRTPYRPSSP